VRDLISVVSAYNLSRNHRTILLLADGEHTVLDLARLSSKPVDEIVALLAELERVGLVYYY
jgi:aminopeptidase-like protein